MRRVVRRAEAPSPVAAALELARLLASTFATRSAEAPRIAALADRVDWEVLARVCRDHRLLALVGTRVDEACPGAAPEAFRRAAAEQARRTRVAALVHRHAVAQAHAALDDAGVPAASVKGVALADALYGDAGMRPTSDVDLLTATSHLERAVQALRAAGWAAPTDPSRVDGLPELHYRLPHPGGILPAVEVHWRLHWYERRSSATLLAASRRNERGIAHLAPEHELPALLLFYARDGLIGLRWPADLAAWWDRQGVDAPADGVARFVRAHPELTGAIQAAALAAERVCGVPSDRVLAGSGGRRVRLAVRLVNWRRAGDEHRLAADLTLTDLLLTPAGGGREFVRRHLVPPPGVVEQTYGLPPRRPLRLLARRCLHSRAVSTTYVRGWARALARAQLRESPVPDGRIPMLLAVHSARRGGAETMALAEAGHLRRAFDPVVAVPDGPLRPAFARLGAVVAGPASLPLWGAGPRRWIPALVRTAVDAARLALEIRRRRLAIVLTNSSVLLGPVIAARLAGVPAVVHVRDVPGSRLARTVFALHGALADVLIVISGRLEDALPAPRRARLVRIPEGVSIPAANGCEVPFAAPLRLTVVGGLDPRKGQDVAVEALARLERRGIEAVLALVGRELDPAYFDRLRRLSADLGLGERVVFRGEQPGADAALAGADIVLAPSRDEWTPLAIMEALARGKPVVASSVGGVEEVIADGRTGILVAADDPDGLADGVVRLAAAPELARRMAGAARRDIAARFCIERSMDALEAELRRTVAAA